MILVNRTARVITLEEYAMGRDKLYPSDWMLAYDNAVRFIPVVNAALHELFPNHAFYVRSGFRPLAINAITPGASKHSLHITGRAIDIADNGGFLKENLNPNMNPEQAEVLRKNGLFMEDKGSTNHWIHLDNGDRADRPSRIFLP